MIFFNRIKLYLVLAGAFVLGVLGIRKVWKDEGAAEVERELRDADTSRASKIRRAVDNARRGGGLHEHDERGYRD